MLDDMSKSVTIDIAGISARIDVCPATTLMGMRRGQIAARARHEEDPLRWYAARFMYADCLACSTGEIDGKPVCDLTFDEFLALPDQITEAWLEAVYQVNPHWLPKLPEQDEQQEKKA